MEYIFSLAEIKDVALKVYQESNGKKIWAFHGNMGAGKTTFIHSLCEVLGVNSTVGSPTYSIINEYKSEQSGTIFHMDWYRLKDEEEAMEAGVEDTILTGDLCLIEWPDKAKQLLPDDTFHITIEAVDIAKRKITTSI